MKHCLNLNGIMEDLIRQAMVIRKGKYDRILIIKEARPKFQEIAEGKGKELNLN
jgi:hypothetical protein